jgi:DnaJ-class molecular chaperone
MMKIKLKIESIEIEQTCPKCHGTGKVKKRDCPLCSGSGMISFRAVAKDSNSEA